MGAETSVVIALFFVGFMFVAIAMYSSSEYSRNLVKNAQDDQDTIKKAKMQTDITILNITNMNITLQNTGKTTLDASALDVFINGNLSNYSLLVTGNTWVPKNNTSINILVTPSSGDRIKIITENGISDYYLVP